MKIQFILFTCKFAAGCKSPTTEEQINETTMVVVKAITENDHETFRSLIGVEDNILAQDTGMLRARVQRMSETIRQYAPGSQPEIEITDQYAEYTGSRMVIVHFPKKPEAHVKAIDLKLEFGPPRFVKLDKIVSFGFDVKKDDAGMPPVMMPQRIN